VLGGSGFLGSHVADHLTRSGYQVSIFDREPSRWISSDQEMVVGDITDQEQVVEATRGAHFVYNFAAIADIGDARTDPLKSAEVNVLGNIVALQACLKNAVSRYVLASSLYVYSDAGSFYRCSKQAAESYVEEFAREFDLEYTILRFGSLYGPRSDSKNGLRQMVRRAVEHRDLSYFGNPEAVREYIHVDDAAVAAVQILSEEFRNLQIVLSGQQAIQVSEVLGMIAEIIGIDKTGMRFEVTNDPGHYVRTPYSYRPSIAKKLIPKLSVDLGQGLVELIRDVQSEVDAAI